MADAAPSAPAAGGGEQSHAPAAPTSGRAAEGQGQGEGGQGQPGGERKPLRPIPPTGGSDATKRANLLGFQPNRKQGGPGEVDPAPAEKDDFPSLSKLRGKTAVKLDAPAPPEGEPKEGASAAPRDPVTGQFVKPAAPGAKPDEQTPAAAAKPGEKAALDPALLVDKDGKPVSEQSYRSLQGMFGSINTNLRRVTEERDTGYRTAHAWKAEAERVAQEKEALEARLEQYERGGQGGAVVPGSRPTSGQGKVEGSAAAGLPDVTTLLGEMDLDSFSALAKTAGLEPAAKFLTSQILETVLGKIVPALQAQQAESLKPFQAERAGELMAEHSEQVVAQVAGMTDLAGNLAFPELTDPALQEEVGRTWAQTGMPREMALTPQGLMAAVAVYRMVKGLPGAPSQTEAASLIQAAAAAGGGGQRTAPSARPASAIAASLQGDGGVAPPNAPRSRHSPATQRLINALSRTELVDRNLGFARNRAGR